MIYDIIQIKNTKLYNFAKDLDINIHFEFLHQFFELYIDQLSAEGLFGYETNNITVNQGDIVVDCGANMGLFSAWAASQGGQVYAFEPGHRALSYLEQTQTLYPNQIHIIPKGVFNQNSTYDYIECQNIGGSHLSAFNLNQDAGFYDTYSIETITLDNYFQNQKIDFLKIDAEGSEQAILEGAKNLIKNYTPKIVIACYHYEHDNIFLQRYIQNLNSNYNIRELNGKLFCWI